MNHSIFLLLAYLLLAYLLLASQAIKLESGLLLWNDNKVTDWTFAPENQVSFAFALATFGKTAYPDLFLENWNHFVELGLIPGAVHRYDAALTARENFDMADQYIFQKVNFTAEAHFAVSVSKQPPQSQEAFAEDLRFFLWLVEHKHHIRPIIYTSTGFWQQFVGTSEKDFDFGSYRFWVFDYDSFFRPKLPDIWNDYYMWETSYTAQVRGIVGGVRSQWRRI